MSMNAAPIIIIGSGLAGYSLAREIRRADQSVPIKIFTRDDGSFYSKPMLSNGFSTKKTVTQLSGQSAEKMREQLKIDIVTHTKVEAVYPERRLVEVNGTEVSYRQLVFAVGAEPISPQLEGPAITELISVNSLDDYAKLLPLLNNKKRIAILGAGLIGCEFANDLQLAGHEVSLIDLGRWPLNRLLPEKIGIQMAEAFRNVGIRLHLGQAAKSLDYEHGALSLALANGHIEQVDVVISAIGLKTRSGLAIQAELDIDKGIIVNRYLETSVVGIYALGDCAQVEGMLLPYVMPIMQCTKALAKTLLGERTPVSYPAMPIIVKTPAFPLAIAPAWKKEVHWDIEDLNTSSIKAICYDELDKVAGFVVGGDKVTEHRALAKEVPHWLETI